MLQYTDVPVLITRTGIGISDPNLPFNISALELKIFGLRTTAEQLAHYANLAGMSAGYYYQNVGSAGSADAETSFTPSQEEQCNVKQIGDYLVQNAGTLTESLQDQTGQVNDALAQLGKQWDQVAKDFAKR